MAQRKALARVVESAKIKRLETLQQAEKMQSLSSPLLVQVSTGEDSSLEHRRTLRPTSHHWSHQYMYIKDFDPQESSYYAAAKRVVRYRKWR